MLSVWFGYVLGGVRGAMAAVILAGLMIFGVYWFCDKLVLFMHRAQPLAEEEAPEVYGILRELSEKAGIPMPKLYLLPAASANAFATGRDPRHAAIAVTHGIVTLLNKEELEGVFGHELSHILNRDSLLASWVAASAGALCVLASMFRLSFLWGGERDGRQDGNPLVLVAIAVLMPAAALLVRCVVACSHEYAADRRGAELCGDPFYLASALRKLDVRSRQLPFRGVNPAMAHLFIVNPLPRKGWSVLFNTHPPVENRISHLEAIVN
ncbi:MAG TPA: M48 family metalloprotease [Candidatus Omnitrophota bacterium]|nr:M48 family metalloprotease [Candidatus Omnitrophota bacterium]